LNDLVAQTDEGEKVLIAEIIDQPMLDQFAEIKMDMAVADARYDQDIKAAMDSFNQAAK